MRMFLRAIAIVVLTTISIDCRAANNLEGRNSPPPLPMVERIADAVLRDFPTPPDFNWGEGVLLTGMMYAYEETGNEEYLEFVQTFADHWARKGIGPLLNEKGYCGHWGPAFPMWLLYEKTRDERHAALAEQVVEFILHKAERTQAGGLSHFSGKPQLWVDTLDMCCPVLSHGARIRSQPSWQVEATRQIDLFAQQLRDEKTGLYRHMWDEATSKSTQSYWARGNGWVVLSLLEVLREEPPDTEAGCHLRDLLTRQLRSLERLQDSNSGLWHTVLDDPDTYLETSASAMFLFGFTQCKAVELDWHPRPETIHRAWQGLVTKVAPNGQVIGVSGGTGPGSNADYAAKKHGTYTWGTGAMLMAACALSEASE
jgi:unsaturated rhamnogalacturonyl hydrolase